jgi:glutathione synthase/RimK-type ligase-like ATP-grasp enzyme
MKTLLAVGDLEDWDSYKKFIKQRRYCNKYKLKLKLLLYKDALKDTFPKISTKEIIVFYFFPFKYWDNNIETKRYQGVYGNKNFYIKFKEFWRIIDRKIREQYKGHKIHYVNAPDKVYIDRDKEHTKDLLSKSNLTVSTEFSTRSVQKVLDLLDQGKKLFIKVRYGSMGKGITFMEKGRWLTNFRFRSNKILSKKSDYGWTFIDITDNKKFLRQLLKADIIIEEGISPYLLSGRKFDFRAYVSFGKVLYLYPRSNESISVTTNISQGAIGESQTFLERIPKKLYKVSMEAAKKSAKAMNLNSCGVDIMPNSDGKSVTIIEANAFPGFPKMKSFNLARYLIREISKHKWK